MYKQLTLFFLIVLFSSRVFSQQEKAILIISAGSSSPVGEFAAGDVNDATAGLAKSGSHFGASVSIPLWRRMGVIAAFISQSNPMNAETHDKQYKYYFFSSNLTLNSSFSNWTCKSAMLGVYGAIPMCGIDKWYFDYRIMGGITNSSSPQMKVKVQQGTLAAEGIMAPEKASSVSYLFGFGFRWNIYKRFCIHAGADYFGTKPKFENNVLTINNKEVIVFDSYAQPINTFNLDFGIGYRF